MPALLVAIVYIAGLVIQDDAAVRDRLNSHFEETIGSEGAKQLTAIVQNASDRDKSSVGVFVGMGMLLLGATGALQELQTALNRAWRVEPDPHQGGIRRFLVKRLVSLLLLFGISLLLIASLAISLGLKAFGEWLDTNPNDWLTSNALGWLHTGVSLAIITVLFAILLRFLPDAEVSWSDVWFGALATAILFWGGQSLLGLYLTWSKPTSAYGAAGSLALVLLWIYYSAMIFFLGAEFTQVLATARGKYIPPSHGARHPNKETAAPSASRAA